MSASNCAETAGGGPERLRIILEGESLLNDASSITLFTIFIEFVIEAAEGHPTTSSAGSIIGTIVKKMIWLAVGEAMRQ
jgi:NhaP-type Na+/H+ or K+/H+ antiporter